MYHLNGAYFNKKKLLAEYKCDLQCLIFHQNHAYSAFVNNFNNKFYKNPPPFPPKKLQSLIVLHRRRDECMDGWKDISSSGICIALRTTYNEIVLKNHLA